MGVAKSTAIDLLLSIFYFLLLFQHSYVSPSICYSILEIIIELARYELQNDAASQYFLGKTIKMVCGALLLVTKKELNVDTSMLWSHRKDKLLPTSKAYIHHIFQHRTIQL